MELQVTLERIGRFHQQVTLLRRTEINPVTHCLSVAGLLEEIDWMNLAVHEYLSCHPSEAEPMEVGQQP